MRATAFDPNAAVGSNRIVIRHDLTDGKPELVELAWGLEPSEPGGRPSRFLRSERKRFPVNRCLIPASEFHVNRGDRKYCFRLEDGNWFYLAGVWRPATRGWPEAYAILTVPANAEVAPYQDRQGAIIRRNRHMQWLDASIPDEDVLRTPSALSFAVEEWRDPVPAQAALLL